MFIEENGEDPIDQAFRNGQVSVVKFLFNKVNAIKPQKWLNSIVFHDPKTIDRLMKCTDLCTPKYYNTLLSLGLEHLKASTIEYALDNGAKLSRFPKASLKKLFAYRKYDVMKVLIDKYGLLNKDDSRDCPIISYAIEHNDEKMFNLLKEKGALIDKKLIEDHDLVNFAMTNNAFGIAELLLEFNPDLDKSKALDSLYNMSSNYQYRKYIYLIDKLIDRGAQISIGRFIEEFAKKAIDIGSPKLVNIALKNGAKFSSQKTKEIRLGTLNKKHEVSRPCTFDNYDSDHCKCLEILFNSGYDPNTVDSYGENMFHNLMRQDVTSLNAVEFLISNGVDINHQSKDGRTPLILCIEFGMHRLIPKMLELGANPNIADEKGQTPIHYAAQNPNSIFTIISLLEAGADINAKSKLNETAFITIMKKDDLEFGSRKQYYWWYNGLTNQEKMEQRMRGVAEIATFLIESGANIKNYPGGGSVCLGRAKELGNADLIKSVREVFHI